MRNSLSAVMVPVVGAEGLRLSALPEGTAPWLGCWQGEEEKERREEEKVARHPL